MVAINKLQSIDQTLAEHEARELVRFVVVGSVDDGKSTLIGRLLYETGGLYEDQIAQVKRASKQGGEIDFSLFTDGLRAEREQGITIDVAYRYFSTSKRKFIIADTPGHAQYTRNMATGASTADAAVILIDARLGVLAQSRRHAYIAALLGIPNLAVAINKMDLVGYDANVFARIRDAFDTFARPLGFASVRFFPVSAARGDNIVARSAQTPWHSGGTILEFLEQVPVARVRQAQPFRLPVQLVLRPHLDYRGFAGRVASGAVSVGDEVVALPSGKRSRVVGIDTFDGPLQSAHAPLSVTVRLADELDIARGDVLADPQRPPRVTNRLNAAVVWLDEKPLDPSRTYLLKHSSRLVPARISRVRARTDLETLAQVPAERLELNDIGRVEVECHRPLLMDPYAESRSMGAFVLIDALTNGTVGAGVIESDAGDAQQSDGRGESQSLVAADDRRAKLGHAPAALLLAPGRAAEAHLLERALFDKGFHAKVVRDGTSALALLDAGLLVLAIARDEASHEGLRASLAGSGRPLLELESAQPAEVLALLERTGLR